jgi:hypothetical protein
MKGLLGLVAVISLGALSASETTKSASGGDPRCSQLRFQSASAPPSYNGRGFNTVEYSSLDEVFIVPRGCVQFFCAHKRETYRVLSCPNLKAKSLSGNESQDSTSTGSK